MRVNWRFPSEALYQMIQTEFNDTIDRLLERRNKQLLYVMYKIVNGNLPPHIVNLFSYKQYLYGLRKTTLQLEIPKPSKKFKKRIVLLIVDQKYGTVYQMMLNNAFLWLHSRLQLTNHIPVYNFNYIFIYFYISITKHI